MRVVHIVPGSGDSFYCQNCLRDKGLMKALHGAGVDVVLVPMYIPLDVVDHAAVPDGVTATPVFFGAINTYLAHSVPGYGRLPKLLTSWLDSSPAMRWVARRAGSTRAEGLEDMTLGVLEGRGKHHEREIAELFEWFEDWGTPDIVHLSNALLLGLAQPLREHGIRVCCSLQDEDDWVDHMHADFAERVWQRMAACGQHVDAFTPSSRYYAERMQARLQIPGEKLRPVYPGIDLAGREPAGVPVDPPAIGYLSRLSPSLGLDLLLDAYLELKKRKGFRTLRLRLAGGATGDDAAYLETLRERVAAAGWSDHVEIHEDFMAVDRTAFLQSLTVLSVPVPGGEAFGMFIPEALSCGVPVVQPRSGAFPELIELTGGGTIYAPEAPGGLTNALAELLTDAERSREMGERGRQAVLEHFGTDAAAERMIAVYRTVLGDET